MKATKFLPLLILLFVAASANLTPDEELFLSIPSASSARRNLKYITSKPHVAGTKGDALMARYVSDQFQKAGIPDVSTFHLEVLLNYPKAPPQVTILQNNCTLFQASLSEDILPQDDTSDTFWRNSTFHGYSPSGSVVAPIVYANYGRPQDFDALAKANVNVTNTIVLVRYGMCFRGLKVMNAQNRGALGVIIYSDPADDGNGKGSVYPQGPWRSASGVQRGSVQFNSVCAGDPMRADERYRSRNQSLSDICGVDSYKDLIPRIPSLPMSYGDALPLLQHMGGKSAQEVGGEGFCGGLPVKYTVGPSENGVLVHMVVENYEETRKIPNVIARIPGTLPPEDDMPVLLGNHRDAW
jgi:N-acetylated-alpha-linked acidic dipeptidase